MIDLTYHVKIDCKSPDINRGTPYCIQAPSNLADVFTFGDKYEASILYSEPIAPSMAHP